MTLVAADVASPNVTIHVHYMSGHGKVKEGGSFCNETKPLPVRFSHHFEVAVLIGECRGGDVSSPRGNHHGDFLQVSTAAHGRQSVS